MYLLPQGVCVCVWQEWISMCVNVYFHLKSKPTVRCQPTYLRTEPHVGTPMCPSRHPHASRAWQCSPRPAGLHSFIPCLLPGHPLSSRAAAVSRSTSPSYQNLPHLVRHLHTQTWALRTGAQLSGALQGRKDYPFPSMPRHTQGCVCVCVCARACVCRPVCTASAWPGPTPNTVGRM